MENFKIILFLILGLFFTNNLIAQINLSGVVQSDEDGEVLDGVSIQVKDTLIGAYTDQNGKFELEGVEEGMILVFSFIGFENKEIEVEGQEEINVKLKPSSTGLDELVLVAFGEQKRENVTSAISEISADDIESKSFNNTTEALQGLAPNLNIRADGSGGASDATKSVNIRGIGSLSGSNPYVVIDGVRSTMDEFSSLNPNDIESVSVLKGPTASAMYGSHAAFGVIVVETKTGKKEEKFTVNYSNNISFTKLTRVPKSVSSVKYAEVANEAANNYGEADAYPQSDIEEMQDYIDGKKEHQTEVDPENSSFWLGIEDGTSNGWKRGYANNDWWDILFKDTKVVQKHDLSISGGSKNTTYHVSAGLLEDPGQFHYGDDNENFKRYNFKSNVSVDVTDWLTVTNINRFSHTKNVFPVSLNGQGERGRIYHDINRFPPFTPSETPEVKDENGETVVPKQYSHIAGWNENNGFDQTSKDNLVSLIRANIDITDNLSIEGNFNYKKLMGRNVFNWKKWDLLGPDGSIEVPYQAENNQIRKERNHTDYLSLDAQIHYEKSIANNHNIDVLVGYQQEKEYSDNLSVARENVIDGNLNSLNVAVGDIIGPDNPMPRFSTLGFFGRFQYNYKKKYLIEFDGRYDGTSRFPSGDRYVFSPSVSLGYNLDKEGFWKPFRQTINRFKIRAEYGSLGNQEVSNFLYLSTLPIHNRLGYVLGGERPSYASAPNILSSNITWETVTSRNIGVDFTFLNDRLDLSADYYQRNTKDMFGPSSALPAVLGTSPPETNSASLKTKGWEIIVGWQDKINDDFSYNLTAQFANNNTYITKYNNPEKVLSTFYEGQKYGEIWGYQDDGLFQSQEEVDDYLSNVNLNHIGTNWGPGDVKYIDLNGDGKVDQGDNTVDNPGDRKIIGNDQPKYEFSLNLGLNWKNFSFTMLWQGVGKRDVVMSNQNSVFWGWNQEAHTIVTKPSLDYWSKDNKDAYFPRVLSRWGKSGSDKNREPTPRYLQNGAYAKLKSVRIGYTFPSSLTNQIGLENIELFISGQNLITITGMANGLDPEVADQSGNYMYGSSLDDGSYPMNKSFGFGVNIQF